MVYRAVENVCEYKKGDIVPDEIAIPWYNNYDFPPVELVKDSKQELNYDLNGDGVEDEKDASIAGKVLAKSRKKKSSKKKASKK